MNAIIRSITDKVATRRGAWITLVVWILITVLLGGLAPSAKDYEVSSIDLLPDDAKSVIAQNKVDEYFESDGIPAILVFQQKDNKKIDLDTVQSTLEDIKKEDMEGMKEMVPFSSLPPQAKEQFISKDGTTVVIPISFEESLESADLKDRLDDIKKLADDPDLNFYVTGPAGIAADSLELFSRADIVLLLSTVGLVLILLIVIYRSPLLALIPLIATAFVYEAVNQSLGLMGMAGLVLNKQSLSIMTILLFAAVIDYSLFVFSRFREELKSYESKHEAMKQAMRNTGVPVFYSGGTVLAAMLVLLFAEYGDYRNFAPIFGTTMAVIMIASITLVPALFTLFGRKSFWPKVPKVGDEQVKGSSFWSKVSRTVTRKPVVSATVVGLILIVSALNLVNLKYQFDTIKSFPEDISSRMGYEVLEEKFAKGDLAPTTVLVESKDGISKEEQGEFQAVLKEQSHVESVRAEGLSDDGTAAKYSLTFDGSPYSARSLDALEDLRGSSEELLEESGLSGKVFFAGETATKLDDREVNQRDLYVIVALETLLIFGMLLFLTRSFKLPLYMMGTILLSLLAALGLGIFLTSLLFGIDSISNRVPLYSFVFLVALGIDYNIILVSRFMEERKNHPVRKAVEMAVSHTGGVISSAGILLAATFAVLMTQPIEILFVFGFIVAVGILLDTFLIRGVLLPALIVLLEKDKRTEASKNM